MCKVTIFTAPKPYLDPQIRLIQRNAVRSWMNLGSDVEVLIIGDDPGIKEEAEELGVGHLPGAEVNEFNTPLISSIFSIAREASRANMLLYLNADILLPPETLTVIQEVNTLEKEYLLVGRRTDLDINRDLTFDDGWYETLMEIAKKEGRVHPTGIDYFIFPKHLYQEIPPFVVGRAGWDNWMIYYGMKQSWPVIDLTPSLKVIHQNHDYRHLPGGVPHYSLEESQQNVDLGGGMRNAYDLFDVSRIYQGGRIKSKKPTLVKLLRKIERMISTNTKEGWRWIITLFLRRSQQRVYLKWKAYD